MAQLATYGIMATVDNLLITNGSQQALDLISKLLINRGDRILVESPTYLGALQAFDLMGAEYVTVPIDGQGLQTRLLEGALRSGKASADFPSRMSCKTSRGITLFSASRWSLKVYRGLSRIAAYETNIPGCHRLPPLGEAKTRACSWYCSKIRQRSSAF